MAAAEKDDLVWLELAKAAPAFRQCREAHRVTDLVSLKRGSPRGRAWQPLAQQLRLEWSGQPGQR